MKKTDVKNGVINGHKYLVIIKNEDKTESGKSILTEKYEGINFISKDTTLYKYLNPKKGIKKMNKELSDIIFPFGANKSQFQAVKNGQTVAVVSNNNAATDNVYEKLQKYNLDYLCARLGNRENRKDFIYNQTGKYHIFEEELENEDFIQNEILELNQNITNMFDIQNDIAKLKEELNEIKLQHQYFNKHHENNTNIPKIRSIKNITSKKIMKLKVEYEELPKVNLWFIIKSQFLYGIGTREFYKRKREDIVNCYNRVFFIVKEMELENTIKNKNKQLKQFGDNKLNILVDDSMKILNDYIIMDESSQVDLITGVLALSVAKNAVIVRDLKQLPNVITTDNKKNTRNFKKIYDTK